MNRRPAILLLAALLLAHCGSSPQTHYFTLAAVPAKEQQRAPEALPVRVAEVHVPPTLDRHEMVRRTGANTVEISDQDRWTAPLGDLVQRVLSEDLAARLPSGKVVLPQAPSPARTASIVLTIAQFGPEPDGKVVLDGSWSLLEGSAATPVLRRDVSLAANSPGGASGQAAAMSQVLAELSDQIAAALAGAPAQSGEDRRDQGPRNR